MPHRRNPWKRPIDPYLFAYALGYQHELSADDGEQCCLMQEDGLCCRIYDSHIAIELFSREETEQTTEYGSDIFEFFLPGTVRDWFVRLCQVEHLWQDTSADQQEFMSLYAQAEVNLHRHRSV